MTYFGFLGLFLGIPIVILSIITLIDFQRDKWMPKALHSFKPWIVMIALCVVAFVYTTPWDNYLVATSVWWYDVNLVSGIVIGWVPIEEYTFFLVQPVMTSLLFIFLARYMPTNPTRADSNAIRLWATSAVAIVWVIFTVILVLTFVDVSYKPFTYLALQLSWALIPIMIQFAFGADIIWRHRNVVITTIVISTLYLGYADALAISSGTWTIDPEQSLPIFLGGVLPIEEFIFFLITNTLVTFGMTLVLAEESLPRAIALEEYAFLRPVLQPLRRVGATDKAKRA
ncbi:MAG: lycopene cyclase domain-containing protein [Chloroflexota bacterium]